MDEVVRRAEGVAAGIEGPIALSLQGPVGGDDPFRCLYLPVGPTFNLLTAQALARAAFGQDEEAPFAPHLSLVYGRMEASQRLALAHEIASELPGQARFDRLQVVRTTGPVSEWRHLARFPLGSPGIGQDRSRH
jgi:2'-5' RNA ligase